jgi:hypothetical protein
MKHILNFIIGSDRGRAEYNLDSETYSWEYDGEDPEVERHLKKFEDGKVHSGISTGGDPVDRNEGVTYSEEYVDLPWDEQFEYLSYRLDYLGAQTDLFLNV